MIEFMPLRNFQKGILYEQLVDSYSFNNEWQISFENEWKKYDDFIYNNIENTNSCGFITTLNGIPIGHITWDPRNPKHVEIGHNCILSEYKGKGYGKIQLKEAIKRIKNQNIKKIIVTTNEELIPAINNYEDVGFKKVCNRLNNDTPFSGDYIDYEMIL